MYTRPPPEEGFTYVGSETCLKANVVLIFVHIFLYSFVCVLLLLCCKVVVIIVAVATGGVGGVGVEKGVEEGKEQWWEC